MKFPTVTISLLMCLGVAWNPGYAQSVQKWVDEQGVTHYSDQKPVAGEAEEIEVPETNVTGFDGQETQERLEKKLEEMVQDREAREREAKQKQKAEALEEAMDREPLVVEEKKKKKRKGEKYKGPYPKPVTERQPKPPTPPSTPQQQQ